MSFLEMIIDVSPQDMAVNHCSHYLPGGDGGEHLLWAEVAGKEETAKGSKHL